MEMDNVQTVKLSALPPIVIGKQNNILPGGREHQLPHLKLFGRAGLDPFMGVSHAQPDGDRLRTDRQKDELSAVPSM